MLSGTVAQREVDARRVDVEHDPGRDRSRAVTRRRPPEMRMPRDEWPRRARRRRTV
ncbi:hypothetical protein [Actinomycetospora straminea]|uniref:Uncharacterized protein n=1 Tax=Actinomycetospora straminea TaxID=663607 RepID=A0ABP9E726_9PSEU|nr:hypothetical protein [Actinomycetospora straminea]MDD7935373.1 hypothetical protein [Actinomycetospora straminea]